MNTLERFLQVMTANSARVDCIHTLADAIPMIESFIAEKQLDHQLRLSPALHREWPKPRRAALSQDIVLQNTIADESTDGSHKLCASRAWAAIADTGTLVLLSGPDNPTRLNFLPDYHLVFVRKDQIVANKKAIWEKLEKLGEMPRALNFISGPSRTADIEQTFQLGANGPRFLWLFVEG